MRVHLYDAALRHPTGHHADWALRIAAALARQGHAVAVWGALGLEAPLRDAIAGVAPGVRCDGLFTHFEHDGVAPTADFEAVLALALDAAREIEASGPCDLRLFPTLSALHLAALAALGDGTPAAGLLHRPPAHEHAVAPRLWDWALPRLRARSLPLRLGAIDPAIGERIRATHPGWPVHDWPQPIDGVVLPPRAQLGIVGLFGHQRPERSLALLPGLTDALLGGGLRVIIHDSRAQVTPRQAIPGLKTIGGFVRDLAPVIGECDLVVCPMDVDAYRLRTSGIASLAIACGRPLLLPEACLSAVRLAGTGAVACYREASVAAILAAIGSARAHYPRMAAAAQVAAGQWRQGHGVEAFLRAAAPQPASVR